VPKCKPCEHPERSRIDLYLNAEISYRRVAARFGLSRASLWRHHSNHAFRRMEYFERELIRGYFEEDGQPTATTNAPVEPVEPATAMARVLQPVEEPEPAAEIHETDPIEEPCKPSSLAAGDAAPIEDDSAPTLVHEEAVESFLPAPSHFQGCFIIGAPSPANPTPTPGARPRSRARRRHRFGRSGLTII
jgi:hypothetical protein